MSDIKTFVGNIIDGNYSVDELNAISLALKARRERAKYENQANLRVGSKVVLHNLRGNWNGSEAEIVDFSPRRTHVTLNITKPSSWKVSAGRVNGRFPISCVSPIGSTPMVDDDDDATAMNAIQAFLGR